MPMLMKRTPYSVAPYGIDSYPVPSGWFKTYAKEGWIFVYQDVRGRYGSEGEFRHMTPHIDEKSGNCDIDESSDTYDTIEWLINNVPNNNGNVGITGNSYGGFYSVAGMIANHPALKCAAPTAPINDMFVGDDFHHNGAFYLPHAFNFLGAYSVEIHVGAVPVCIEMDLTLLPLFKRPTCLRTGSFGFGKVNPDPTRADVALPYGQLDYRTRDGYDFYLKAGEH